MKLLKKRRIEKSYLILVGVVSLFVVIGYFSYAMFTVNKEQKEAIRIITGTLPATLSSSDSTFKDNKITVLKDSSKDITITLTNNNDRNAKYNFYYKDNISEKVHINYYKDTKDIPPTEEGVVIKSEESQSYKLKIINLTNEDITVEFGSIGGLENKELSFPNNGKIIEGIVVEVEKPADNMIPVVYNESKKKWITTTYDDPNWYNYDKQEWANAITVKENIREEYKKSGKEVDIENDVLTMFVWIPRYSYTIKSEDGKNYYGKKEEGRSDSPSQALPGEIDVKFIDISTTDNGSAQYTGDIATNWYTPPGFKFGEKNLSGVWIGKFETGTINNNSPGNIDPTQDQYKNLIAIKPSITPWRGVSSSTFELLSMNIVNSNNIYGFDDTYDSHAAKNTEWALIVYLTQSKYGKYGNPLYTGENKHLYPNNKWNGTVTGCSAGTASPSGWGDCKYYYDNLTIEGEGQGYAGGGASTTGNIYGIYDLAGGLNEALMANFNRYSGYSSRPYTIQEASDILGKQITSDIIMQNSGYIGQCGFDQQIFTKELGGREWQADKYYDFYTSNDPMTACNGSPCKGHALNEVAGWFCNTFSMVNMEYPWIDRGGYWESGKTCIFRYGRFGGYKNDYAGTLSVFRVVLTPNV